MNLEDILVRIKTERIKYGTQTLSFISDQKDILRNLSCLHDELTDIESQYFLKHQKHINENETKTASGRKQEADSKYPEYIIVKLKKDSLERLIDSVRSTLSKSNG